jgi:putative transposase
MLSSSSPLCAWP